MTTTSESEWGRPAEVEEQLAADRERRAREHRERLDSAAQGSRMSPEEVDASWGFTRDMSPEQRRARIAELADRDELAEDPVLAERTMLELRAIRDEEMVVQELGARSFESLPAAVRKLYRQNPSNPRIRALYDTVMRELFERTEDTVRGALLPAVEKMVELIDSSDDAIAFRAATYVFERVRGKTPEVIEHRQDKPFQVVLERVVSGPRSVAERLDRPQRETEPEEAEIVAETLSGPISPVRELMQGQDDYAEERAIVAEWDSYAG